MLANPSSPAEIDRDQRPTPARRVEAGAQQSAFTGGEQRLGIEVNEQQAVPDPILPAGLQHPG